MKVKNIAEIMRFAFSHAIEGTEFDVPFFNRIAHEEAEKVLSGEGGNELGELFVMDEKENES